MPQDFRPIFDEAAIEKLSRLVKAKMEGNFNEVFAEVYPETANASTTNGKTTSSDPAIPTQQRKPPARKS